MQETPTIFSRSQNFTSDIGQFSDGDFQQTSTPTHSQTISNESALLVEFPTRPVTSPLHGMSLPAVVDAESCQGCKILHDTVTAMESKISKLSEMVTEHNEQLNQINRVKTSKSRQSEEMFTDNRLMRIKAAAFLTGRPLLAHMCKQLVLNMYDNEPPCVLTSDHIKAINDQRECRDAQSLSKWAVFELFSLQELVGRNCLGGGRDSSADEIKKPFDEGKMQIIKNAVFQLYPQPNDIMRKAAWMKCVDKIK